MSNRRLSHLNGQITVGFTPSSLITTYYLSLTEVLAANSVLSVRIHFDSR